MRRFNKLVCTKAEVTVPNQFMQMNIPLEKYFNDMPFDNG